MWFLSPIPTLKKKEKEKENYLPTHLSLIFCPVTSNKDFFGCVCGGGGTNTTLVTNSLLDRSKKVLSYVQTYLSESDQV